MTLENVGSVLETVYDKNVTRYRHASNCYWM